MNDDVTDPGRLRWRRVLVRAGRAERASSDLRARVFALRPAPIAASAMTAANSTAVKAVPVAGASTKAAGVGAIAWKLGLLAVIGVVAGASVVVSRSETRPPGAIAPASSMMISSVAVQSAAPVSEIATTPVDELPPANPVRLAARPKKTNADDGRKEAVAPPPRQEAARLVDEMRHVEAIRSAANSGRPAEALRLLEEYRASFPSGALTEEAEALRIESLSRLGRATAAAQLARRFLKERPSSPYTSRIEATLASLPEPSREE